MNSLEAVVRRLVPDLQELDADYAVVGGVAVGARSQPRFTRDIDVAVATADDAEAERVAGGLLRMGYRVFSELDNTATDRLATLRMVPPMREEDPPIVDLLFASCGIEREVVGDAQPVELYEGLPLPTAQRPHLVAMKLLSEQRRRGQDTVDLYNLLVRASDAEVARAAELVDLITERGYARRRNLRQRLERHLRIARSG